MKIDPKNLIVLLFALLTTHGRAEIATLTVTPSVVSNTYTGVITLNITGLANAEQVGIQTFLDLNANGVIDPGEPLLDAFKISDGGAMIIGGATNINVPFDSNPTGGAITTALNFAPPLTFENTVGQHIYKLVSPVGNFTPVTATLTVTNASTGQYVTGTVYSNGVAPLPYALVVALPPSGYIGATVADASGHYMLNLNPGAFNLFATLPNFYGDESLAPSVNLTNGGSATNNLFATNGGPVISGLIYDAGNSNGLGGVLLELESGNLLTLAFSDTNGIYSAAVTSNFWKVKPSKERLARRAYVVTQQNIQVDATAGSSTNGSFPLIKGNALFYGRITDQFNTPFANIQFDASDGTNNQYNAKGYSDGNGNYAVAAVGAVSGDWNVNPSSSANAALANYILNETGGFNIAVGQAIHEDFTALLVTATISGQVRDNLGQPVTGVSLFASTYNGSNNYQSLNADVDSSGNYSLGVTPGTWYVNFSYGGEGGLDTLGYTDYFGPYGVTIPPTNALLNITVYQNGAPAIGQPSRNVPGQFSFFIYGSLNANYTVQYSTNLASTNWGSLYSLQLTNVPFFISDTHATNSARFYRVLKN